MNPQKYLLPKGRKDQGESITDAAVRETFEETGYPCTLFPVQMPTRAPAPGNDLPNTEMCTVDGGKEAIAVHVRPTGDPPVATKLVFWFIAQATGADRIEGSQMSYENFVSVFLPLDEAAKKFTYETDRKVVEKAVELVARTLSLSLK